MRILLVVLWTVLSTAAQAKDDLPGHNPNLVMFVAEYFNVEVEVAFQLLDARNDELLDQLYLAHQMGAIADISTVARLVYTSYQHAVDIELFASRHHTLIDRNAIFLDEVADGIVMRQSLTLRRDISRRLGWIRRTNMHLAGQTNCQPYDCISLSQKLYQLEENAFTLFQGSDAAYSEWLSFRR